MAIESTEDDYGRQIAPIVANESEDGTGDWHSVLVDSNGYLIVVAE